MILAGVVLLAVFAIGAWVVWAFFLGPSRIVGQIQKHDLRAIEWYLRSGVSPNRDAWLVGGVFHCAVASGDSNIVMMMIERGADINRIDGDGDTPLHVATHLQNVTMMRLLVSKGADISRRDRGGRTALELAEKEDRQGPKQFLEELVSGKRTNN